MRNFFFSIIYCCALILPIIFNFAISSEAAEKYLFRWDAGSGENWPGWKYSDDVAYGHPGWTMLSGQKYKWGFGPRCFEKGSYGANNLASIDPTDRAPSTKSGGCFKVYEDPNYPQASHLCSWWMWYDGQPLKYRNKADGNTDRWSFYIKLEGTDPILIKEKKKNKIKLKVKHYNFHVGTYLGWENPTGKATKSGKGLPYEGPGNQHYYHHLSMSPGTWIHVLLDNHPQHKRNNQGFDFVSNNPSMVESGKNYLAHLIQWYMEIRNKNENETAFKMDEMKFYSTKDTIEPNQNDISISSVWVGYWKEQDLWEISWQDGSFKKINDYSNSVFEIRYSTRPIDNWNYRFAKTIEPIFFRVGDTNLIKKAHSWGRTCWTRFTLPDEVEQSTHRMFFAIKDMSKKGEHVDARTHRKGDGHDAPSPYIHTIDYYITPEMIVKKTADRQKLKPPKNLRIIDDRMGE